jgi:hypothetical protein
MNACKCIDAKVCWIRPMLHLGDKMVYHGLDARKLFDESYRDEEGSRRTSDGFLCVRGRKDEPICENCGGLVEIMRQDES